jgi:prolipoprotein diacylglyceryltransferase
MIIHKINFPFYGLIIALSVFIGLLYIYKNLRREGIEKKYIFYYALLFIPFAFIGGKLYTLLVNFDQGANLLTVGLSAYGGLFGVIIASIIYEYIKPSDKKFIKYTVLSLPLIYGLTKIACSIVGCCHGIPYSGPFNVNYIDVQNEFLFPVQILEVILNLLLFYVVNKHKDVKYIIPITLISVSVIKFLTDFLRYEHIDKMITANQIFSIYIVIVTIMVMIILNIKKRKNIR